jgi:hypothetical protein
MNPTILSAFSDELVKISASHSAKKANRHIGLPIGHPKARFYDAAPSAAQSADASQYPVAGMGTGSALGTSNALSPTGGPGGV